MASTANKGWGLIVADGVMIAIAALAVLARFIARTTGHGNLGWDDYIMLAALVGPTILPREFGTKSLLDDSYNQLWPYHRCCKCWIWETRFYFGALTDCEHKTAYFHLLIHIRYRGLFGQDFRGTIPSENWRFTKMAQSCSHYDNFTIGLLYDIIVCCPAGAV